MPELPEVEIIRRSLSKQICDAKIVNVNVFNKNTVDKVSKEEFESSITGSTISSINRRGKYFLFNLDVGTMVLHLRMDGQLYVTDGTKTDTKYAQIAFTLSDGRILHFDDKRKFAKAHFVPLGVEDIVSGVNRLGVEPFDDNLTAKYLKRKWGHKYTSIKETLLEQDVVAGIGNFYSDDILFLCGIYPKKRCVSLSDKNYEDLAKTIPSVMQWGIDLNASVEDTEVKAHGRGFVASNHSYVYGRAGKPCRVCGSKIESYKFGNRTCCYCPSCQRTVKIIYNNISANMLRVVAEYIGSYMQINNSDYWTPCRTSEITWEEFVLQEYSNIMTEDCIQVGDQYGGKWRLDRIKVFNNMSDSSFQVGIGWVKSQKWKEQ